MIGRVVKHRLGNLIRWFVIRYYRSMGVVIGEGSFVSLGSWIDVRRGKVIIGKRCVITNGCKILSHDMTAGRLNPGASGAMTTFIGDDVFIGMNAVVLPGVTIGNNCIIGAGTIVSKDVPSDCVVVGAGFRIVRKYDVLSKKWVGAEAG
jgi:acetyltransferase-like isoleucine patch superfamily enzyme